MALLETFSDSFDSSISGSWTAFGSPTIVSGQLNLHTTLGTTNYEGINSNSSYDLTGSYGFCQVINAGNQALVSLQAVPIKLAKDGSNSLAWYVGNSKIVAQKQVAGTFSDVKNTTTYNSSIHKYFKIREQAGTIYWDFSTDGVTWTNYTSLANPFSVTSLTATVTAGTFSSEASSSTCIFDNFNIITLAVNVSDTIVRSESTSVFRIVPFSPGITDGLSLSDTVSLSTPYPYYDEVPVRRINHELDVSWKSQDNLSSRTFTIGTSTIGSMDIIGIDIGTIGSPSNYIYFDESDYVIGMTWEHAFAQPIGGLNTALAEAVLDNTSQRFTPEFMGGTSELYTATFEPRKPVIFGADIDPNAPQIQFTGITNKANNINLRSGTLSLSAVDYIDYFKSKPVDNSPMYTSQRSDQIIGNLLARAGLSSDQYELETGQNTIGFALFDTGVTIADAISALVEAEDGQFYQDETGKFHFENRLHYSNSPFNQVVATIPESMVLDAEAPNQDHIVNVVEVNYNPRVKTSSTTIFTLSGTITLPTGLSDVFLNFDNPVLAANAPVFTANNQADGSGTNVTSSVNIHNTSLFAQAVKYSFNNTSGAVAYITSLTIQGRWAVLRYDNPQYFRAQDDSSVTAFQEQKLSINNDYIQDITWASSFAQLILNDYADPAKLLNLTIRAKPNLRRGDLVNYKSNSWRIYRIRSSLDAGGGYIQQLSLVQRGLASGSGVVYFKIGNSTIGGTDEIAP